MNIAIICAGSYGDILNCTPLAYYLKLENKSNHIDWYTTVKYKEAIRNNSYIDKTIYIDIKSKQKCDQLLIGTMKASELVKNKKYDIIYKPAPYLRNWTINHKLHIIDFIKDICNMSDKFWQPIIKLEQIEIDNVSKWMKYNHISKDSGKKIMIEFNAESGQSNMNINWIEPIIKLLNKMGYIIILAGKHDRIINKCHTARDLSIRECAELYKYCTHFIGCSSGISCACVSDWSQNNSINNMWIEECNSDKWSIGYYKYINNFIKHNGNLDSFINLLKGKLS